MTTHATHHQEHHKNAPYGDFDAQGRETTIEQFKCAQCRDTGFMKHRVKTGTWNMRPCLCQNAGSAEKIEPDSKSLADLIWNPFEEAKSSKTPSESEKEKLFSFADRILSMAERVVDMSKEELEASLCLKTAGSEPGNTTESEIQGIEPAKVASETVRTHRFPSPFAGMSGVLREKSPLRWQESQQNGDETEGESPEVAAAWKELAARRERVKNERLEEERLEEERLEKLRNEDRGGKVAEGTCSLSILDEAARIVEGDREQTYGTPSHNLNTIALFWSTWLHARGKIFLLEQLSTDDVCAMMSLLKIARLGNSPTHRDSQVDACGYMRLMEKCQQEFARAGEEGV